MIADAEALVRALIRDVPDYPKPGVLFKDITPLLADAEAFAAVVDAMVAPHRLDGGPSGAAGTRVDKVVGIEARGFILAAPVAYHARAGFVPVRKKGKLPSKTVSATYSLEYGEGTVEAHVDAITPGERVLVVDDVLATGGTAAATVDLVERLGGVVLGCAVLLELAELGGRARLPGVEIRALLTV